MATKKVNPPAKKKAKAPLGPNPKVGSPGTPGYPQVKGKGGGYVEQATKNRARTLNNYVFGGDDSMAAAHRVTNAIEPRHGAWAARDDARIARTEKKRVNTTGAKGKR